MSHLCKLTLFDYVVDAQRCSTFGTVATTPKAPVVDCLPVVDDKVGIITANNVVGMNMVRGEYVISTSIRLGPGFLSISRASVNRHSEIVRLRKFFGVFVL